MKNTKKLPPPFSAHNARQIPKLKVTSRSKTCLDNTKHPQSSALQKLYWAIRDKLGFLNDKQNAHWKIYGNNADGSWFVTKVFWSILSMLEFFFRSCKKTCCFGTLVFSDKRKGKLKLYLVYKWRLESWIITVYIEKGYC